MAIADQRPDALEINSSESCKGFLRVLSSCGSITVGNKDRCAPKIPSNSILIKQDSSHPDKSLGCYFYYSFYFYGRRCIVKRFSQDIAFAAHPFYFPKLE